MTKFQPGDIVRIELAYGNHFRKKVEGYDARLTRIVLEGEESYESDKEKWYFRMLEGPMANSRTGDYYCVPTYRMYLRVRQQVSGAPLKKRLPDL